MSLINKWSEGKCKVVPITHDGATVYARVRAATQGEMQAQALLPGKAGANLGAFVALVDVLREQTQGLSLRGIIEQCAPKFDHQWYGAH